MAALCLVTLHITQLLQAWLGCIARAQLLLLFVCASRIVLVRVGWGVAAPRVLGCGATARRGEGCPDLADGTAPEGRWLQADGGGGGVGSVTAVAGHRWAPAAAHSGWSVCRAVEVDWVSDMGDAALVAARVAQAPALAAPELGGGPALTDVQGRGERIRPPRHGRGTAWEGMLTSVRGTCSLRGR